MTMRIYVVLAAVAAALVLPQRVLAQPIGTMSELMIRILYPTSDAVF